MLFNSSIFLFAFLPAVILLYYLAGAAADRRLPVLILVVSSLFFYAWWNPGLLSLIVVSVLLNYVCGLAIAAAPARRQATSLFIVGAVANLGLLGYFKYAGFFVATIDDLLQLGVPVPQIILPIAISFYTFQQIAYLADVRSDRNAERSLLNYALFVTFFPQLIAGPIVHHKEVLPQYDLAPARRPDLGFIALGATVFTIGLFKKMLIADTVARYATPVFGAAAAGEPVSLFEAWTGTLAYTFQIYFDFSGYSDMAIGLGLLFGIKLPLNFFSPYKATSIIDFWRRWHMTLSRFLRDYLYFPLGGNRKGRLRRYLNLAIVMLLGGLWHGAGWTFVAWGALHGLYLAVNHFWRWVRAAEERSASPTWLGRWMARLLTFFVVVVAWVFFRAENMAAAYRLLASMFGFDGVQLPLSIKPALSALVPALEASGVTFTGMFSNNVVHEPAVALAMIAALIVFVWATPTTAQLLRAFDADASWLPRIVHEAQVRVIQWQPSLARSISVGIGFALCVLSLSSVSEFIYFNF